MSDSQLTGRLEELGLTSYQSKAYVAAVRSGKATPQDLVDVSGVPQGRIYDVLYDLEEMGLVEIRSRGRGKEIIAPSPEDVLGDLKRRRIDELSDTIDTLSSELRRVHDDTIDVSDDYVTMASREQTALRHIKRAIEAAEYWLVVATSPRIYRQIEPELQAALDGGVTVRLLMSGDDSTVEHTYPEQMSVRSRATADTVVAADRTYGIFGSNHPIQDTQRYLITQESNLVLLLQDYTETVWGASAVVQTGRTFPRRYLDPRRAITDLRSELDDGTRFRATIEGYHTDSHEPDTWEGEIADYELRSEVAIDFSLAPPTVSSLTLSTSDERLTVGGWRATVEDIAATGIEITPIAD
ncbi:TrmB family transcriptional regulator [Haloarcula sp. JP-L23]|uniref:TrmB family transcriptional regulator n=1 Tax=Haloarcula sp. JP-L23 TaxID=2716717 RepID=UPI00140F029B|nr:TrmB family transcriptional regulator [Haloarcula sp. JP-L23]